MTSGRPNFLRIDHDQLAAPAGSETIAREFFGVICGMKELAKPENLRKRGGLWFQVGSSELHVGMEDPKKFHPSKKGHPAFEVKDLQGLKESLSSHGIGIREDEALAGAQRFYADDPFGNRLEFIHWKRKKQ